MKIQTNKQNVRLWVFYRPSALKNVLHSIFSAFRLARGEEKSFRSILWFHKFVNRLRIEKHSCFSTFLHVCRGCYRRFVLSIWFSNWFPWSIILFHLPFSLIQKTQQFQIDFFAGLCKNRLKKIAISDLKRGKCISELIRFVYVVVTHRRRNNRFFVPFWSL